MKMTCSLVFVALLIIVHTACIIYWRRFNVALWLSYALLDFRFFWNIFYLGVQE